MITEAYINAIKSNNRYPVFKIEWMDKDEIVVDEVITDMISGNISMQLKNGIRRTCNLTLENKDGSYIPSKDGLVWIGKKNKIILRINNRWC